jgi:ABC-type uncharacterized transport system involved in gliding motility auxiliary subunit
MSRYHSLLGALGGVALLFGIASLLLSAFSPGVALWDLSWIWGNFVLGALLLVAWAALGFEGLRERMSSGEARRVGTYGSSAIASTVLAVTIVAALGYFAARNPHRFDWTESGVHSLSDQSKKLLAGLERDVQVTALFPRAEQVEIEPVLERYAYESERFKYTMADPNERPDLVEALGIERERLREGLLHVALGEEHTTLTEVDEEGITNALVKLTRTGQKKVYFLAGHNERPVAGPGSEEAEGLARAAEALANENYAFEDLLLATRGEVPEDADAVVVAGPTLPLIPQEEAALERYLDGGGALLVMVDPNANTNLYGALSRWGVDLGADVIVDYLQGLFGRATTPLAAEYPSHPINAGLREPVMFHVARSVRARPEARERFSEIVRTSAESWAERNLTEGRAERGADDLAGPVPVAVAGSLAPAAADGDQPPREPGRLVVYGDSDFVSNQLIDAYRNRDLFVNSVNWLLGDVEAISIRPGASRASRFNPSQEQFTTIRYLSLFVLPELIAVLGVLAWWWRRRAPGR